MFGLSSSPNIITGAQKYWVEILESYPLRENNFQLLIRDDELVNGSRVFKYYQVTFFDCLEKDELNYYGSETELLRFLSEKYPGKLFTLYNQNQSFLNSLTDRAYKVYRFMDESREDENYYVARAVRIRNVTTRVRLDRKFTLLRHAMRVLKLKHKIKRINKS